MEAGPSDPVDPSQREAPSPLMMSRHDPHECYRQHGYALHKRSSRSHQLAAEIETRGPRDARYTLTIAGEMQQLDVRSSSAAAAAACAAASGKRRANGLTAGQLARIQALAIDTAHEVTQIAPDRFEVGAIKVLTAAQGKGEQPIHWDSPLGFSDRRHYSFLLYTTDGCDSTAMWRLPRTSLPQQARAADMRAAAKPLFDKMQFHRVPVQQGEYMFFSQALPHFGVHNATMSERRVVFVMLTGQSRMRAAQEMLQQLQPMLSG